MRKSSVESGIARHYDIATSIYDVTFTVLSLGLGASLHSLVAREIPLSRGDTVLDLGCGTGLLIPYLVDKLGEQGKVIGVDISPKMIRVAEHRVRKNGWTNVRLECQDIAVYTPPSLVDGVVFCLSLSTVREYEHVLRRALTFLKPRKDMMIVDALLNHGKWYYHVANVYTRFKALIVRSFVNNQIREIASDVLADTTITVKYLGLYSLIHGKRPLTASAATVTRH